MRSGGCGCCSTSPSRGTSGNPAKRAEAELARREATLTLDVDGERSASGSRRCAGQRAGRRRGEPAIEDARLAAIAADLNPTPPRADRLPARRRPGARLRQLPRAVRACKGVDLTASRRPGRRVHRGLRRGIRRGGRRARCGVARLRARAPSARRHPALHARPRARRPVPGGPARRMLRADARRARDRVALPVRRRARPRAAPEQDARARSARRCAFPARSISCSRPVGGHDDFAVLFHEGGHTEHYASVDPGLAFEFRMLGDNAITESFAFLLERLVENPLWLARRPRCGRRRGGSPRTAGRPARCICAGTAPSSPTSSSSTIDRRSCLRSRRATRNC